MKKYLLLAFITGLALTAIAQNPTSQSVGPFWTDPGSKVLKVKKQGAVDSAITTQTLNILAKATKLDTLRANKLIRSGIPYSNKIASVWGTSITAGTFTGVPVFTLGERFTSLECRSMGLIEDNQGISGATSVTMVSNISRIPVYDATKYKLLQFEFATNDFRVLVLDTGSFKTNMGKVIDTAIIRRGWPASSIIITTPSVPQSTYTASAVGYTAAIKHLAAAKGIKVADIYTYMAARGNRTLLNADSIHPNPLGLYYMAECITRTVSGLPTALNINVNGSITANGNIIQGDSVIFASQSVGGVGGISRYKMGSISDALFNGIEIGHGNLASPYNINLCSGCLLANTNIGTTPNIAGGYQSQVHGTSASGMVTFGSYNALDNITGVDMTLVGEGTGQHPLTGPVTAVGKLAAYGQVGASPSSIVAIGSGALFQVGSISGTVGVGDQTFGQGGTVPANSTAVGHWAGYAQATNGTPQYHCFYGTYAGYTDFPVATTGNTMIGGQSGEHNTGVNRCVFLGLGAGFNGTIDDYLSITSNQSRELLAGKLDSGFLYVNRNLVGPLVHIWYPDHHTNLQVFGNGKFTALAYAYNGEGAMLDVNGRVTSRANNDVLYGSIIRTNTNNTQVVAGTITAGGTGYTQAIYSNVPLTGGTGTQCYATVGVNSSGVVTSVIFLTNGNDSGTGYTVGDVLSATGIGPGSGFTFTVTQVGYSNVTMIEQKVVGNMQVTGSLTAANLVNVLYTNSAFKTVTNTTTETTIIPTGVGSLSIPASTVGQRIECSFKGTISVPATPGNVTLTFYYGSTPISSAILSGLPASGSGLPFTGNFTLTTIAVGGSGSAFFDGNISYSVGSNLARLNADVSGSGGATGLTNNSPQTFNVTATWDTANSSKSITCSEFILTSAH